MAKRKDGKETRQKLLDIACEVFAEKGFREAKITEICRLAGANVAAVNYYFGDKDSLYVAAWRQAMQEFLCSVGQPPENLSSEEQLGFVIRRFIGKILSVDGQRSHFRRLELMELANPTGLIDEAWKEEIAPRRQEMIRIVRDIMGPGASEDSVRLCEMSIVNQCRGYILLRKSRVDFLDDDNLTPERVDQIAEHTIQFSLAGIRAIRDQAAGQRV
jgi:TetR/AcrR family transcriptional regulator, regulator of cefoperazone and chloramphenicol sensitivity